MTRFTLFLASLAVLLPLGCAPGEEVELVGQRADGLTVVCSPAATDGRYACDPQAPAADGCASWQDGGPALVLWPPNHELERVTLDDCARVRAACGDSVALASSGRIVAVTSDEPLDALGDGQTVDGDLAIVSAREVRLRSERQGGGDGRVYRIESEDDLGHHDFCEVHVPHDRGPYGGALDSGEAVRVTAP